MGLLKVVCCVLGAWCVLGVEAEQTTAAQECVLYEGRQDPGPAMVFQRRVTAGVVPRVDVSSLMMELQLRSSLTGHGGSMIFLKDSVVPMDLSNSENQRVSWPPEMFSEGNTTELWLEVDEGPEGAWELRVVGRRDGLRANLFLPDTGLQPPVTLSWVPKGQMQYYYNCVTGCLFEKTVTTQPGVHTVFLWHTEDFTQMTLNCGNLTNLQGSTVLAINITSADLGPPTGMRNVTAVWDSLRATVGVLVDGVPVGNLIQYGPLEKSRRVDARVEAGSGGLVAACDPRFQEVEKNFNAPDVVSTTTTTTTAFTPTPSDIADIASDDAADSSTSYWLSVVFSIVMLNFLVTIFAVVVAAFLYHRATAQQCTFSKGEWDEPAKFEPRSSTRSSTRSANRGSQRRNKNQNDATTSPEREKHQNHSDEMLTTSETVTTPLNSPDFVAGTRVQRSISTNDFVSLELI